MTSEYDLELTASAESREVACVSAGSPSLLFGTLTDKTVAPCVGITIHDFQKMKMETNAKRY